MKQGIINTRTLWIALIAVAALLWVAPAMAEQACTAPWDTVPAEFQCSGSEYANKDCAGKTPTICGTSSDDVICGTNGQDVIYGGRGRDKIWGFDGRDHICGGGESDQLRGGKGGDVIRGGGGDNDICHGNEGQDDIDCEQVKNP